MSNANARVRRDDAQQRYVLEVNGEELGSADFKDEGNQRVFTHTAVDPSLKGQGLGSKLVQEALEDTRGRNRRIVPVCEFVAKYLERHTEYESSVDWPQQ
ncbi:GNAT family N-acetyltransferase [Hydrocarboniclastica marina]|uniref:N-acetyltransferase n=1 Tax=Hydrocarboniclastica marina TaxID=2259620 RepID=A0A4P7XJK7_9ALTE|nr:GNAT family N-acetyltransferase [Hydrocarboniclastica marina]MAL99305.1 GNAT family N-acetyltransferase [Alteromonadaceae bacterium]QCF26047.1 N-acetyltransferase [Hydrocarboniclastica marina]|tara:strand:+ start:6839 stop:7138 length:300 start_codon:yes stop_codon:yes gene_type:complete